MDLELTAEQQELRSLASELLEQRVPRETPRAYLEGRGEAADLWAELAELGLGESPRVGEILAELRRRKLDGELDGRDAELAAARELIEQA